MRVAWSTSARAQFQQDAGSTAGPIAPSDRIAAIDIVRGIALFGVMAINVTTIFRASIFERFLPDDGSGTGLDRALYSILMGGIDLKAFALFSLLFGVGLAIQYDHLSATSRRTALLVRRLAFLMLIGAAHLVLIWNGDILFEYAIAGFVVLPFLFCRLRILTLAGTALLALFLVASYLPELASMPSRAWMTHNVAEATRIYGSGGFAEVLAFRVHELPAFLPLHVFMFPRTVALMLIGAVAWRADLFQAGSRANRCLPLLAVIGVLAGGSPRRVAGQRVAPPGMAGRPFARTPEHGPAGVRLRCSDGLGIEQDQGRGNCWRGPRPSDEWRSPTT